MANPWLDPDNADVREAIGPVTFRLHPAGPAFTLATLDESISVPMLRDRAAEWLVEHGATIQRKAMTLIFCSGRELSYNADHDAALIQAVREMKRRAK